MWPSRRDGDLDEALPLGRPRLRDLLERRVDAERMDARCEHAESLCRLCGCVRPCHSPGVSADGPLLSLDDYEALARERLDPALFAGLDGGAGDELTMRANRRAWERLVLRPRVLVDVGEVATAATVLGRELSAPVLVAPMGFQELLHPDGVAATARGAARAGTVTVLSTIARATPAEVAAAAPGAPTWFQLYCFRDRGLTREIVRQAVDAGSEALVLTVDGPVLGRRERARRAGWSLPDGYMVGVCGLAPSELQHRMDPTIAWRDLEWLAACGLPLVLKGILTAEDARLAAEHGAAAVVVSNHGGRQLDGVAASADALPEVVEAAAGRLEVLVDGGVRRGDARARGARARRAGGAPRPARPLGAGGGRGGRRRARARAAARGARARPRARRLPVAGGGDARPRATARLTVARGHTAESSLYHSQIRSYDRRPPALLRRTRMRSIVTRSAAAAVVALAVAAVAVVGASAGTAKKTPKKPPASCNGLQYGHMGPLTGPAAVLGQEQLHWGRLALQQFNASHHTNFKLVEGDTQLSAAQGSIVAQSFASNGSILAVVGPAGSQVVKVAGPIFAKVDVAMVSESATDGRLSDGDYPTFFRVNANNDSQAPTLFLLISRKLQPKKVMVVDDQSPDKTELANEVAKRLERKGIAVQRESVSQKANDFSSLIARIDSQTGVVLLSFQIASEGQLFAQQMRALGKNATVVGANGLYSPKEFNPEGAYVASFGPDIRFNKGAASTIKQYVKQYGADFGTYGPPTYVATQVVLNAMWTVCSKGTKPTRSAVLDAVRKTHFKSTILGTPLMFAKNGNSRRATFFLFQVKNGKYVPATTK